MCLSQVVLIAGRCAINFGELEFADESDLGGTADLATRLKRLTNHQSLFTSLLPPLSLASR
jgi:hypothetical protein